MVDLFHVQQASAREWVFYGGRNQDETAVIRLLQRGDRNAPEVWYRVVTYAPVSGSRRLIAYCRTFEAACSAAWDYSCAIESWNHNWAAKRQQPPPEPDPYELLVAYRAAPQDG